ncbi:MAG TPA: RDD family protein [Solirubrobacteraceae bacterium]|nr:RDD family protein [Solirubrobacteraceae bacterium]
MGGVTAAGPGEAPVVAAPAQPTGYAGLATRVVSFTVDAAIITVVDVIIGVGAALILSLLHIPHDLRTILAVIGAVIYAIGSIAYFAIFWSTTGQTPGARLMQIQVLTADLGPVKPKRALVRCVGVILAALPLFIGFVPILYDSRRRGFQDQFAHTVVVEAPGPSIAEVSRAKKRAIYEASRRPVSERDALDG